MTAPVSVTMPKPPRRRERGANAAIAWLERTNPLTRLTIRAAQQIYDTARLGSLARLQYIYAEIEKTDPTLFICVDRRLSALSALGWRVTELDASPEAARQRVELENLLSNAENLSGAIEHLGLAFFRGFSFAAPYLAGKKLKFELLPSWEFNHAEGSDEWWHNPLVAETGPGGSGQTLFDPADALSIVRPRAIDYPALAIFLRHAVAEDGWARFLERYGVPPVILEMPPLATDADADKFAEAARSVYEALCGAVPNGTRVNTLAEARGADPFSAFIEHQERSMVRLATGGTLGSIAEATGLGSGASEEQGDVWQTIVRRDAAAIGEEFTRWFARFIFPQGMKVRFELGIEDRMTPDEVFATAGKAAATGWRVSKAYLEKETGWELEDAPQNPQNAENPLLNAAHPAANGETPLQTRENPLQNSRSVSDGQGEGSGETPSQIAKNRGISQSALGAALEEAFLDELTRAAAGAEDEGDEGDAGDALENSEDANGAEHDESDGRFTSKGAGTGEIDDFKKNLPASISPEMFDALLATGFDDVDGNGNQVKYGALLRDHINNESRNPQDRDARKKRLGVIVKLVRDSKPVPTSRPGGNERIYTGTHGGKAYIAVADEHNEIGAFVMVSYRRDGKHDTK